MQFLHYKKIICLCTEESNMQVSSQIWGSLFYPNLTGPLKNYYYTTTHYQLTLHHTNVTDTMAIFRSQVLYQKTQPHRTNSTEENGRKMIQILFPFITLNSFARPFSLLLSQGNYSKVLQLHLSSSYSIHVFQCRYHNNWSQFKN